MRGETIGLKSALRLLRGLIRRSCCFLCRSRLFSQATESVRQSQKSKYHNLGKQSILKASTILQACNSVMLLNPLHMLRKTETNLTRVSSRSNKLHKWKLYYDPPSAGMLQLATRVVMQATTLVNLQRNIAALHIILCY